MYGISKPFSTSGPSSPPQPAGNNALEKTRRQLVKKRRREDKGKLEKEVESSIIPRRHLSSLEKERELDPLGEKGRPLQGCMMRQKRF